MNNELTVLRDTLRSFAEERDWNQFHSPKNLAMALIGEAGELIEHFQWLSEEGSYSPSPSHLSEIREELADILIYLVRLADKLDVNLVEAANDKIEKNRRKYPAEQVRGSAQKYSDYE